MTSDAKDDLPAVSVILPHLNQIGWLEKSLQALREQTYPRDKMQIIVVDNGSRPEALEHLKSITDITVLHESEPGPGLARNLGVRNAAHDFLAFIDSDCLAAPDWLMAAIAKLRENPDCAIGGDVRIGIEDPDNWTDLEAYESVFAYRMDNYIKKQNFTGTGNLAMKRATYDKVGPFAGINVAEDRDWGRRAHNLGVRTLYCSPMRVYHPARKEFSEMQQKWRRHTLHDFEDHRNAGKSLLAWYARAFAVFASGFVHILKIATSDRVPGLRNKVKAARCLIAIRSFRAAFMVTLSRLSEEELKAPQWNR
ncbi:glycosyltransferase [Hwanghaeella grinnelliae]|uniref:Glycosyltransferase n=1 Tax=Hwanghaeella grinnelliae TaxID=2500179 RepID=A0A3S2W726_9PROT|nr:glycosyltransferase [Hwanghaeella grinnelliae]RVU34089.1 glycosyltransferase [Hwanghaeella grinnelliae]